MRIVAIFLSLTIMMFACRPAKKVQKIQEAISKVDTTPAVIVADNNTNKSDTISAVKDIYDKVVKNRIVYATFNSKVRVGYQGKEGGDEATAFVRMKKDSAIWISLRGALGIEGFRVLITQDSVKVMNLLKKNVQFRSIAYLQEITDIPFDLATLQDLIVGNPVFIDSNIISYKVNGSNELLVLMGGKIFKHLLSLDDTDYSLLHSKLDDIEVGRNRTCDITFSDYNNSSGVMFSTRRRISVAEQSKLDIDLDFKQYTFNQPLTFPFNIPKNYKRL
jgi:hypothetical protein